MTNKELIIETEGGERFIADVRDFEVEVETSRNGMYKLHEQYRFEVETLINSETGEQY